MIDFTVFFIRGEGMGIQQKNITLIFRCIQPETLYRSIFLKNTQDISARRIESTVFHSVAHQQYPSYSFEEIDNIFHLLENEMQHPDDPNTNLTSAFYPLVKMGRRVLRRKSDTFCYEFSQALAWRNVYQDLGQDLFTTAFLAYEDLYWRRTPRNEFLWEAILKSNNSRIHSIVNEGIAENHCHLGGTTQNFPITWACIMNYPKSIEKVVQNFNRNLQAIQNRGALDNVWSWEKRLYYAAYIRYILFSFLEGFSQNPGSKANMFVDQFFYKSSVPRKISALRNLCGARVKLVNGSSFVLDYALRAQDCKNGMLENHYRLLSGERSFLYRCFQACFSGVFDEKTQSLFYIYLLIKENFRAEIVQVNRQPGFYNFKEYQDRKDMVYENYPGYQAEALRLSINAHQTSQKMVSYEARIGPKLHPKQMLKQLREIDRFVCFAENTRLTPNHFYVYHFIKFPDKYSEGSSPAPAKPRNIRVRKAIALQAKAMYHAFLSYPMFCRRVYGIDAANLEIGCRPEIFAQVFRYLNSLSFYRRANEFSGKVISPELHITYHAGEDFLDIVDGLRAVDEAAKLLGMQRGCRIGHALAVGIDAEVHYKYKQGRVVLPKQDFLDNIVWMLYRSQELGVQIDSGLEASLRTLAEQLLFEIYGNISNANGGCSTFSVSLYEYYCSMQLRGDAPELYRNASFSYTPDFSPTVFRSFARDPRKELVSYRANSKIYRLVQAYHFDSFARKSGAVVAEYKVDNVYISAVRSLQNRLLHELKNLGIMIECNPTSNYLIGTFRRYDRHPITRFNNAGLLTRDGEPLLSEQISVSINTDDLGVFDTSLENEYAMMASALEKAISKDGKQKYDSDSVYRYLDNVRRMGIEQSFKSGQ